MKNEAKNEENKTLGKLKAEGNSKVCSKNIAEEMNSQLPEIDVSNTEKVKNKY